MADGTSFQIDVGVSAAGVTGAADSVSNLANKLDAAGKASTAATAAVKAGESAYKASENAALRAAVSLEKLGLAIQSASGAKLQQLLQRQVEATAKANSATAAMNAEAAALDKLKIAAKGAADAEFKLGKQFDATKKAAGSGKANEIAEGLGKLGGPLGSIGQQVFGVADGFKKMSAALGSAGPYVAVAVAIVAIAAAVVAVTVAMGAAVLATLKFAVANADAARTARLLAVEAKGGAAGLAATKKLALSLDSQAKRLTATVSRIFSVGEGSLEKFLEGLDKLVSLFDENTASSNAIQTVFRSLFDPLLEGITAFVPKMIAGFIQFEILVLKALIAIKPFYSSIVQVATAFAYVAAAITIFGGILIALVIAPIVIVGGLLVGMTLACLWLADVFTMMGSAIKAGVGAGLDFLTNKFNEVVSFLQSLSLAEIGTAMIDGLVNGIMGAGPKVLSAITGLATGAITAAKKALGIASPSKVFAEIGMDTAAGMEEGVDGGASDVQGSMESLVAPPASGGGSAQASGSGHVFNINVTGGGDAQSIADKVRDVIQDLLTQAGGAVPVG